MSDLRDDVTRDTLIAYSFLPFLSPARLRLLREHFGLPREVALASTERIAGCLNISADEAACVKNPLHVTAICEAVKQLRHRTITWLDPEYPPLLREIPDPPSALYVEGDASLLSRPAIAVVGSRRASAYGLNASASIARDLAGAGVTVISGMAAGVDSSAHRAAIDLPGRTVAVLGTGIDQIYPGSHRALAREIRERGSMVTEFAPGTPPRAMNFPIRNRIIAGLCLGTVIVEATGRSGSLITARMAAEQGREVFAIPGPIFHRGSEGPHRLIQYGAKLVHNVDDIFVEIASLVSLAESAGPEKCPSNEPLLRLLRWDEGTTVDELSAMYGRAGHELAEDLFRLEAGGWIHAMPGGRYIRVGREGIGSR